MLQLYLFLLLLCTLPQIICQTVTDPKTTVRLSEIHLNTAWLSDYTSFTFVELFTPNKIVDLTGLTVVFYSSETLTQFSYCFCDGVKTNNLGYGSCNCGLGGITTSVNVGAVALHNVPSSVFKTNNFTAEQAVNLNMTDVVLYQTYGTLTNNLLQDIFTPGQVFRYIPLLGKYAYSIVRCYGYAETNAKWQAAFSLVPTATQNMPNLCPVPVIYVNEIHLNKTYIELSSTTPELPLDEVTLAVIVDNATSVVVINSFPLVNQRLRSDGLFTIGAILGADVLTNLNLPVNRPTVIAVYFNVTVVQNSSALLTNFTSSIIYSNMVGANRTVPTNLKSFGKEMYPIDLSGKCSLSVCLNQTDVRSALPTPMSPNNCTVACSLNIPQATVRLSEVHSNVAWAGSQVTFTFVEVYTPLGSIDLTGLSVIFYFAYDLNSWNCCSCNGIRTNEQGYALCNCGPKGIQRIPADVAYQGAITLQLVDASYFANPVPASLGSQLNVIDAILYQSYGPVDDTNPLKPYFASGQHFVIPPPITQSAFSTDRCYGDPLTTGSWQASFTSVYTASPNAPNPCPSPQIQINQVHFNTDFVELYALHEELPLDQVILAYVSANGIISNNFTLTNERVDDTKFFSIGNYPGVDLLEDINLPMNGLTALVVYFNITIKLNQKAPTTDFVSSIVYSNYSTVVPPCLLPFGNETVLVDFSGKCSIGACSSRNESDFELVNPSIDIRIDCTTMTC